MMSNLLETISLSLARSRCQKWMNKQAIPYCRCLCLCFSILFNFVSLVAVVVEWSRMSKSHDERKSEWARLQMKARQGDPTIICILERQLRMCISWWLLFCFLQEVSHNGHTFFETRYTCWKSRFQNEFICRKCDLCHFEACIHTHTRRGWRRREREKSNKMCNTKRSGLVDLLFQRSCYDDATCCGCCCCCCCFLLLI